MIGSAWRHFRFFESVGLTDPPLLPPPIEVVSCCLSHAYLFVGDCGGRIHVLDRAVSSSRGATAASTSSNAARPAAAAEVATFQGYTGAITHMKYVRSRNLLVTLGDDDALNTAVLRLWEVDPCVALCQGAASSGGVPWRPPSREHRLFTPKHPAPSAAAGAVLVRVNQNEDRLRTLRLRASSATAGSGARGAGLPAAVAAANSAEADGIPATSLLTCVVAFDVSEDGQSCAVALTNGECVVLHGDLGKDHAVRTRRIRSSIASGRMAFVGFPPKGRVCLPAAAAAAAGGAATKRPSAPFTSNVGNSEEGPQLLYTVYDSMTTVWAISATGECTEYACHEGGRLAAAGPGCACISPDGRLAVCTAGDGALAILGPKATDPATTAAGKSPVSASPHDEAVCFDPTGAAGTASVTTLSVADDGSGGNKKKQLLWHAGYVVLLSESPTRPEQFHLQCYDPVNHIRALSRSQEQYTDVAFVLSDGAGELLVLSQVPGHAAQLAYNAVALREIDVLSKLDLLFSKECYGIAKSMADQHAQGVDPALHRLIEKRYADYLYSKGKYAEAMDEYIACIGSLEPSYVIRRYMQSQHIELLTRYLEVLHQTRRGSTGGAAHVSHTTLLLNCYIRQQREDKLLVFVRRDDVRFDAPNAIAVCRQGGQYEAALLIADKYAQAYERASILIHDLHAPREALDYIGTLGVDDAEAILMKTGKQLVAWEPLRTTDVLLQLCVRWNGPARRLPTDLQTQRRHRPARRADAKDFLHVFVDAPVCLLNFLRGIVASGVLEAGFDAAEYGGALGSVDPAAATSTEGGDTDPEAEASRKAVYDTLFELYVTKELRQSIRVLDGVEDDDGSGNGDGEGGPATAETFPIEPLPRRLEQAMTFLEAYDGRYDDYVALSLCHQHHFEAGILFLLRKLHLSADLINYYGDKMMSATSPAARRDAEVKLLREVELLDEQQQQQLQVEGISDSQRSSIVAARKSTWMTLLSLLVQSPQSESQDVVKVLDYIDSEDILSPTVVMELLCGPQSHLQLRTVRGYCQRALLKQFHRTQAAQEQTAAHLRRVEELKQGIHTLQTTAIVFPCAQCAHCGQPLDFPAVHFMCRHSFHQRCLNVSTQCNLCAPAHRRLVEEAKERLDSVRSSEGVDLFFKRLEQQHPGNSGGVSDGFGVVTEAIANGALGPASATSSALAQSSARRPEAFLFAADPAIRAQRGSDAGKAVYTASGDVVDAETVEWW